MGENKKMRKDRKMDFLSFVGGLAIGAVVTHLAESKANTDAKPFQPSKDSPVSESKSPVDVKPAQPAKPAARLVMQREIARFCDLLEPLYLISTKAFSLEDSLATLEQWEQRLSDLADADNLIKKWESIAGNYKDADIEGISNIAIRWMNLLAAFEISRDDRNQVQVNEAVRHAYEEINKTPLVDGERMFVKNAAWFKKTDVIRRGVLTKESV